MDLWAAFFCACENWIQQVARLPSLKLQLEEVRKILSVVLMFECMDVVTECLFSTGLEWMSLLYFEYLGYSSVVAVVASLLGLEFTSGCSGHWN